MMTCEALINEFLHDYHAGTLPALRRAEFNLHLSLCRDCRRYVKQYKKTIALTQNLAKKDLPEPPQQLIDSILKIVEQGPPPEP